MQRVTRDAGPDHSGLADLVQTIAIITKHFPPSVAQLYAAPRTGKDGVREWWTELEGQPRLYRELNADQQASLLNVYEQRQDAIRQLAAELEQRGLSGEAVNLRRLIGPANLDNLYSVNGQPLLVRWGEPVVAPAPAPAPPLPPVALVRRRWIWLPWFLLPLLALLALLAALWFGWPYLLRWFEGTPEPAKPFACIKNPTVQPPELSVVLDTSGSMRLSVNATLDDEEWFFENQDNPAPDLVRLKRIIQGPIRMDVAKQSLTQMVNDLHPAIDMRIVTFDGCRTPVDHGVFNLAQRPALIQGIQGLVADDGTALSASLDMAARSMNGRDRDGVIVMFVDGADGCGQNVCEVAQRIAREQPRLKVNLINISNNSLADCIADSTGGQVYSAKDAAQLAVALEAASQDVSSKATCD
ncbi:VWA domain-containing protein [Pseudomonas sp. H9]|uniref:VWA domain-containing protein n=1 Tax=Pseudomonas sp. H9 TaxID=483968 RepID=UPI001057DC31|nr:VWA domain-containing protein [Pseudomonas sp. H9]TDF79856.1 VWA domain-containing protein [Pseudomonas sp. H9]